MNEIQDCPLCPPPSPHPNSSYSDKISNPPRLGGRKYQLCWECNRNILKSQHRNLKRFCFFWCACLAASLVTQLVKNPRAMQETWVQSLGWEGLGEENGYPLQYSCLENPHGQRSLVEYSPWGQKESDMTEQLSTAHEIGRAHV